MGTDFVRLFMSRDTGSSCLIRWPMAGIWMVADGEWNAVGTSGTVRASCRDVIEGRG